MTLPLKPTIRSKAAPLPPAAWKLRLGLLAVLLLAAGLRFHQLGTQSFWNDEGNAARLAERSLALIIRGAQMDVHPPAYYLLLHGWQLATGLSEFAQRSLSALCGLLTVAVAAAVGRRAGGPLVAAGAALLVAVNPLAVYYSQETRMYALLGLVTALTLWATILTMDRSPQPAGRTLPRRLTLALFLGCLILGLYTQYMYALALLGLNLAFGLWWLTRRPWQWRPLTTWVALHLLAALAFLPWLPQLFTLTFWRPPDLATVPATTALQEMARALLFGITLPDAGTWGIVSAGLLLLLALFSRPRSRLAAWAAAGMALVPLALLTALGAYRPAYLKFLLVSTAPLAVVLALPLRGLSAPLKKELTPGHPEDNDKNPRGPRLLARDSRPLASGLTGLLAGGLLLSLLPTQARSLQHLYTDPAYRRDDYRSIAAWITAESRPGDAIILDAPNQWEVFTYYYQGPLPVYPALYHPEPEETTRWAKEKVGQHRQLFVLYWGDAESDPHRWLEGALATWGYKAQEQWMSSVRVARYGTGPAPQVPEQRLAARLGETLQLEGYSVPVRTLSPGDVIPVVLFWQAPATPGERLKVFVHLLNAEGQLIAQNDSEPVGNTDPTDRWPAGKTLADHYGILIPPELPPGAYTLQAGMYRLNGDRLPVTLDGAPASDVIRLGTVTIDSNDDKP